MKEIGLCNYSVGERLPVCLTINASPWSVNAKGTKLAPLCPSLPLVRQKTVANMSPFFNVYFAYCPLARMYPKWVVCLMHCSKVLSDIKEIWKRMLMGRALPPLKKMLSQDISKGIQRFKKTHKTLVRFNCVKKCIILAKTNRILHHFNALLVCQALYLSKTWKCIIIHILKQTDSSFLEKTVLHHENKHYMNSSAHWLICMQQYIILPAPIYALITNREVNEDLLGTLLTTHTKKMKVLLRNMIYCLCGGNMNALSPVTKPVSFEIVLTWYHRLRRCRG